MTARIYQFPAQPPAPRPPVISPWLIAFAPLALTAGIVVGLVIH